MQPEFIGIHSPQFKEVDLVYSVAREEQFAGINLLKLTDQVAYWIVCIESFVRRHSVMDGA